MSDRPRPYILAETNWQSVKDTKFEVAVLPWGATEAHNYHLPYATDNYQADFVCAAAAKIAWEREAKIVVLPCIPFGVNTGQLDIELCINMNPSTQLSVLADIAMVLQCAGIEKLIIVNGHGGNHFKQMLRELSVDFPDLFACAVNWYEVVDASQFFEEPGDHAGELETSCMMHIAPDICRPLADAGPGAAKRFRFKAFQEGWASAPRQWTDVTEDTGVGNPAAATAEKGEALLKATAEKMAEFFCELSQVSLRDLYE